MSDVDRELERLFWPAPKRAKSSDAGGLTAAVQLLMSSDRPSRRTDRPASHDRRGADAPVAGGQLLREELRAHIRRAPQVMVKITGKSRGVAGVKAHLQYIGDGKAERTEGRDGDGCDGSEKHDPESRNGARLDDDHQRLVRPLITETGERIATVGAMRDLIKEWQRSPSPMPWTGDRAEAVHVLWQMPPGTDAQTLLDAVQASAQHEFAGHRYALALHQHQNSPHVHMIVRVKSDDGMRRLNPRKADLHRWRMRFAHELRGRGVDAAASRQRTRGYAQRHEHLWERKMSEREEGLRERALRARSLGRPQEADELDSRADAVRRTPATKPRPSDASTERQIAQARAKWDSARAALARSPDLADRELAEATEAFMRQAFVRGGPGGREVDPREGAEKGQTR